MQQPAADAGASVEAYGATLKVGDSFEVFGVRVEIVGVKGRRTRVRVEKVVDSRRPTAQ